MAAQMKEDLADLEEGTARSQVNKNIFLWITYIDLRLKLISGAKAAMLGVLVG